MKQVKFSLAVILPLTLAGLTSTPAYASTAPTDFQGAYQNFSSQIYGAQANIYTPIPAFLNATNAAAESSAWVMVADQINSGDYAQVGFFQRQAGRYYFYEESSNGNWFIVLTNGTQVDPNSTNYNFSGAVGPAQDHTHAYKMWYALGSDGLYRWYGSVDGAFSNYFSLPPTGWTATKTEYEEELDYPGDARFFGEETDQTVYDSMQWLDSSLTAHNASLTQRPATGSYGRQDYSSLQYDRMWLWDYRYENM